MKRIVVIGPESTGKSTLCEQLAKHYNTVWCPEYAREFLLKNGINYNYNDLMAIAKGQLDLEDKIIKSATNGYYFIDTNMYVMKVWCEVAFSNCHTWILKQIAQRPYDHYLLCNVDLPWVQDELREYPDLAFREYLYKIYRDILINNPVPWSEISGTDEERLKMAVKELERGK